MSENGCRTPCVALGHAMHYAPLFHFFSVHLSVCECQVHLDLQLAQGSLGSSWGPSSAPHLHNTSASFLGSLWGWARSLPLIPPLALTSQHVCGTAGHCGLLGGGSSGRGGGPWISERPCYPFWLNTPLARRWVTHKQTSNTFFS